MPQVVCRMARDRADDGLVPYVAEIPNLRFVILGVL